MSRYKVSELDPELTTGSKKGTLYYDGKELKHGENAIEFYLKVLSYLAKEKKVDIKKVLPGACNETGKNINDASKMEKI